MEAKQKEEALKKAEEAMRALQASLAAKDQNVAALSGKVREGGRGWRVCGRRGGIARDKRWQWQEEWCPHTRVP